MKSRFKLGLIISFAFISLILGSSAFAAKCEGSSSISFTAAKGKLMHLCKGKTYTITGVPSSTHKIGTYQVWFNFTTSNMAASVHGTADGFVVSFLQTLGSTACQGKGHSRITCSAQPKRNQLYFQYQTTSGAASGNLEITNHGSDSMVLQLHDIQVNP